MSTWDSPVVVLHSQKESAPAVIKNGNPSLKPGSGSTQYLNPLPASLLVFGGGSIVVREEEDGEALRRGSLYHYEARRQP